MSNIQNLCVELNKLFNSRNKVKEFLVFGNDKTDESDATLFIPIKDEIVLTFYPFKAKILNKDTDTKWLWNCIMTIIRDYVNLDRYHCIFISCNEQYEFEPYNSLNRYKLLIINGKISVVTNI